MKVVFGLAALIAVGLFLVLFMALRYGRRAVRRAVAIGVVVFVVLFLFLRHGNSTKIGGQGPAEPFRIADNLYFVGASDVSAFLITGPSGHVVLDAGYPTTARLVMDGIARLGFNIKDVKVLINSEPHPDHAGGLAVLQQASGAGVWASDASADAIAAGGDDPDVMLPLRMLIWTGVLGYPPARIDHRIKDGETVHLGPIALTAHVLGGHSRGCTSWSFPVRDGDRTLNVVSVCDLTVLATDQYPQQRSDLQRSFRVLRGLPVDIWMTAHGRSWGRYRKFSASRTLPHPTDAFIDPDGYRKYIEAGEEEFRQGRTH